MDYLQPHRGGKWRVRVVVPTYLVEKIGKRVLTRSTGTDDFDRATKIATPIIREFRRMVDRAAGRNRRVHLRHSDAARRSVEWFTPPVVFQKLGVEFDMDVASPGAHIVQWIPARVHITENSLDVPWRGLIWMNAPFGVASGLRDWLAKFITHRDGIALLPANSYTRWFQETTSQVDAVLLISGYLEFIPSRPLPKKSRASFGSCLLAIGDRAVKALRRAEARGLGVVVERRSTA